MSEYELGHKKQPAGNSLKYGGGNKCYDDHAHNGHGRQQENATRVSKGDKWNSPTPHSSGAVVRDGVEGHGSKGRGYQTDAHTETHHNGGEAAGSLGDNKPFKWESPLYAEGKTNYNKADMGHSFIGPSPHSSGPNKAEHHPRMSDEPHRFNRPSAKEAHGYGHSADKRMGVHRLSGHDGAHMVGTKPTRKSATYKGHSLFDK